MLPPSFIQWLSTTPLITIRAGGRGELRVQEEAGVTKMFSSYMRLLSQANVSVIRTHAVDLH